MDYQLFPSSIKLQRATLKKSLKFSYKLLTNCLNFVKLYISMNSTDLKQIQETLKKIQIKMSTKDDLRALRKELKEDLDQVFTDLVEVVDKNKADKKDLVKLENRVTVVEEELHISSI